MNKFSNGKSRKDLAFGSKDFLSLIFQTAFITSLVLFVISPLSCRLSGGVIELVSSDYECPRLLSYSVEDSSSMRFAFSRAVSLDNLSVFPENSVFSTDYEFSSSIKEGACFVQMKFSEPLLAGREYNIYGEAKDSLGNSLSFCLPFKGYNSNVAELEIIEVHPKYQGESKGNGVFKNEYVLFEVIKSGNLSSLSFISGQDGEDKAYFFPSIEVKKGEKIALHLRNKGQGCISEREEDITLSFAAYSSNSVRDLWLENESARLGDEQDVLVLINSQDKKVVSAFCYSSSSLMQNHFWKSKYMQELADKAFEDGCWEQGSQIENAFVSDGITASKSFVREGQGHSAAYWKLSSCSLKNSN
ncbi:MAG: hypothetical protein K6E78_02465 [Treponema sp.]|nr:hypothetical protein [Treponema sp.]